MTSQQTNECVPALYCSDCTANCILFFWHFKKMKSALPSRLYVSLKGSIFSLTQVTKIDDTLIRPGNQT